MKTISCVQGSPEWLAARIGLPTASCFDKILTPTTLKPSGSQGPYMARLLAEWFLNSPLDEGSSGFMERGTSMEEEAAAFYAFATDGDVQPVGFCLTDDGAAGCSPDRLVGADGLLEIKCPSAGVHMHYHLNPDKLRAEYWSQVQGELYVTGRAWADLFAYHPVFPKVTIRIERDAKWADAFDRELGIFNVSLAQAQVALAPEREAYRQRIALDLATGDSGPF